jgi:hypothetical protein
MIATPQNRDNLGSHMHLVLYFGVLIRSSFGGVCEHRYIRVSVVSHGADNKVATLCAMYSAN